MLLIALLSVAPPAAADDKGGLLSAGVGAFEQLRYRRAVELLRQALSQDLDQDQRVTALRTLGLCHAALDEVDEAKRDFTKLLEAEPQAVLDRGIAPRVRAVFDSVRATALATRRRAPDRVLDAVPELASMAAPRPDRIWPVLLPRAPIAGRPLTVSVDYPGVRPQQLLLYYRTRGTPGFSQLPLAEVLGGHFDVMVPGMDVQGPGLDYYLVALDGRGEPMARGGGVEKPLSVDVTEVAKPFYKRAWFWCVVGGAVAATAGGVALGLELGTHH